MDRTEYERIKERGRQAARAGYSEHANPYRNRAADWRESEAWLEGYAECAKQPGR